MTVHLRLPNLPLAGWRARWLGTDDAAELQALYAANPGYHQRVAGSPPPLDAGIDTLKGRPPDSWPYTAHWVIGFDDPSGRLQAVAEGVSDLLAPGVWHLGLFFVAEAWQGQGVAQSLLASMSDWASGQGARWWRLCVVQGHARAERFWRQQGFAATARRGPVRLGAQWNNVWVMVKPMAPGPWAEQPHPAWLEDYRRAVPRDQPDGDDVHRPRPGTSADAQAIAALAIQVFLDTYAERGVRPDLAAEAFDEYGLPAFAARLAEPTRLFLLAELDGTGLVGFAEVLLTPRPWPGQDGASPSADGGRAAQGAELVRLYVQPRWQGQGMGSRLLRAAERAVQMHADGQGVAALWLTAWDGNTRAHGFYAAQGYLWVGCTQHEIQGQHYGNRVYLRQWAPAQR